MQSVVRPETTAARLPSWEERLAAPLRCHPTYCATAARRLYRKSPISRRERNPLRTPKFLPEREQICWNSYRIQRSPSSCRRRLPTPLRQVLTGFSESFYVSPHELRIEVRFSDCGHSMWIPLGHNGGHSRPCYACDPELGNERLIRRNGVGGSTTGDALTGVQF
jgi:hypothetical protein